MKLLGLNLQSGDCFKNIEIGLQWRALLKPKPFPSPSSFGSCRGKENKTKRNTQAEENRRGEEKRKAEEEEEKKRKKKKRLR